MEGTKTSLDEFNEQIDLNEKGIIESEQLLENIEREKKQISENMEQDNKQSLENMEQRYNQLSENLEKMGQDMKQRYNQFSENMEHRYNQFLEYMEQRFNQFLTNMEQRYNQFLENMRQEREGIVNELNLLPINNNENEISNKLEEIELNQQFKNKEEEKCAICLEVFSIGDKISYLPCFHFFHSSCIKNWIRIKNKCPFCNNVIK